MGNSAHAIKLEFRAQINNYNHAKQWYESTTMCLTPISFIRTGVVVRAWVCNCILFLWEWIITYFLWGWNYMTVTHFFLFTGIVGTLFVDNTEAAFSLHGIYLSLGNSIELIINNYTCTSVKMWICLALLLAGFAGYYTIELLEYLSRHGYRTL